MDIREHLNLCKKRRIEQLIVNSITHDQFNGYFQNDEWVYNVTYAFRDALDIQFNKKWTQGARIEFKEGDFIRSRDGSKAVQVQRSSPVCLDESKQFLLEGYVDYDFFEFIGDNYVRKERFSCSQIDFLELLIYGSIKAKSTIETKSEATVNKLETFTKIKDDLSFKIILDEHFINICEDESLEPIKNKSVLSLMNDFEDGEWRYNKFQNYIWDNVAQTALSYKERKSLVNQSYTSLTAAAQNLRLTDKEKESNKGSEIAEIILYGIMKDYYGGLPVVPKIFYKQNAQDNAKGADGVHIVVENGDFSLWFGEAKFYNSIEDARLSKIVTSVANSLKTDKLKKENSIVTSISDLDNLLDDPKLKDKIKVALSNRTSIDELKPKIHIPIFILYECSITAKHEGLSHEYKTSLVNYHIDRANSYFKKQIDKIGEIHRYQDLKFHIILFPVPKKSNIVDKFIKNAKHLKEQ